MRSTIMKRSYLLNSIFISKPLKRNNDSANKIMFKVESYMTKHEIKHILEHLYKLRVQSINTILMPGKKKRSKYSFYRTSKFKKAIVTLKRD